MTHGTEDLDAAITEFKRRDPPAVLVSPSIVRGVDLPGDDCRLVILGKVPWPDSRDPVAKARKKRDPQWLDYEAMKAFQQAAGRAVRFLGDWAEVVVVDDDVFGVLAHGPMTAIRVMRIEVWVKFSDPPESW